MKKNDQEMDLLCCCKNNHYWTNYVPKSSQYISEAKVSDGKCQNHLETVLPDARHAQDNVIFLQNHSIEATVVKPRKLWSERRKSWFSIQNLQNITPPLSR